jgi:hypothetical protein
MIPFEELAFSPNKEFADRLSAAVGSRRFVVTRDAWPPWQRLVSMFGWPMVCRAAEAVEPGRRYPPAVEATCANMKRDAEQAEKPAPIAPPRRKDPEKAALFAQIRARVMEKP